MSGSVIAELAEPLSEAVAALGADAARQGAELKAPFEAGIKEQLKILGGWIGDTQRDEFSDRAMAIFSTMVGAVILARAVNNTDLARVLLRTRGPLSSFCSRRANSRSRR